MSLPSTRYKTYSDMFFAWSPIRSNDAGDPDQMQVALHGIRILGHRIRQQLNHGAIFFVHLFVGCDQIERFFRIEPRQRIERARHHRGCELPQRAVSP